MGNNTDGRDMAKKLDGFADMIMTGVNHHCPDLSSSPTDTEMLDWIEHRQVSGEWIHNAIHWDGRKIRDCITSEILEENNQVSQEVRHKPN